MPDLPDGSHDGAAQTKNLVVHADEASFVKTTHVVDFPSVLNTLSENFKSHLDKAMTEMKDQSKRDTESILSVMQQESAKRTALEHRLHSQPNDTKTEAGGQNLQRGAKRNLSLFLLLMILWGTKISLQS